MSNQSRLTITSRSPQETQALGVVIGKAAQPGNVILLNGNLGSGKTCLTQGIARGLGINQYTTSPSFVLVRELRGRLMLYHVDLYRLENTSEIEDLGLDDYLYGQGVTVVEWAQRSLQLLPAEHLRITLEYIAESGRTLKLQSHGERYRELLEQIKINYQTGLKEQRR